MSEPKILALFGPTASSKSSTAMRLCEIFDAHILNMDSMQIYKRMDIGTAKPTAYERSITPHHLYDLVEPNIEFSVKMYKDHALKAIKEVRSQGKTPLLVGGTGLYLSSLYYDFSFRKKGRSLMYLTQLQEEARKLRPDIDDVLDMDNPRRVARFVQTGQVDAKKDRIKSNLPIHILSIEWPRAQLHQRIQKRIDQMLHEGLLEELQSLRKRYPSAEYLAFEKAIGYKEFLAYLDGSKSFLECKEELLIHTRQYAKRQETWARNQYDSIYRFKADDSFDKLITQIRSWLEE